MDRLNKYLAHAGVGSRRQCDALIQAGRVTINGARVAEPGVRVNPEADKVCVDETPVRGEKPTYWALHKPRGVLCTNYDPAGRTRAVDYMKHVEQRVYTVGRLDEDSEGLILLTNDGELAQLLMHPRHEVPKTYLVQVAGFPSPDDLKQLLIGVFLAEGRVKAKSVKRMKSQGNSTWLRIVLAEGKNREIRRMLAKRGHKVMRLRRVAVGPVKLDRLPSGKSRRLSKAEVEALRKCVRGPRKPGPDT